MTPQGDAKKFTNHYPYMVALLSVFGYYSTRGQELKQGVRNMSITKPTIPQAGDRIGSVCGPCQSPKDNAGTVLTQVTDRWGTYALVLMDNGTTKTCHGLTKVGIGWYLISQAAAVSSLAQQ